jgi:serine/threonine protein kinase
MSPEVILNKRYDHKVDVYSFGIVMYELFFEKKPFIDPSQEFGSMWSLGIEIANEGRRPLLPADMNGYSDNEITYLDVMQRCWSSDPVERPSFDDIAAILLHLI